MNRKIFILDDDIKRINWFKEHKRKTDDIIYALNSYDAIKFFNNYNIKFDLIFLDHDLSARDTAIKFAEIIKDSSSKDAQIYIHSMNPVGQKNLERILKSDGLDVTIAPFGTFKL